MSLMNFESSISVLGPGRLNPDQVGVARCYGSVPEGLPGKHQ